jgi:hypothetical protein
MQWENYEPSDVDDTIDRVQRGELTPDAAERMAIERGWPPFKGCPDTSSFDPMKETRWTLVMAVSWIMHCSIDAVREVWTPYRSAWRDWKLKDWSAPDTSGKNSKQYRGHFLESREPLNLKSMELRSIIAHAARIPEAEGLQSFDTARKDLWDALGNGRIIATSLDTKTGTIVDIPAREWPHLKPETGSNGEDELRLPMQSMRYKQITLSRSQVLEQWRPLSKSAATKAAELRAQRNIEADIRSSPHRRLENPEFYKEREIEREEGKLSKRGADRAYKAAVQQFDASTSRIWTRPGPTGKRARPLNRVTDVRRTTAKHLK